jgi:hypothetical protein
LAARYVRQMGSRESQDGAEDEATRHRNGKKAAMEGSAIAKGEMTPSGKGIPWHLGRPDRAVAQPTPVEID